MSGRKSSEVVDLLANGERIRRDVLANNINFISKVLEKHDELQKVFKEQKLRIEKTMVTISELVKEKYKKDAENLEKSLKSIDEESENLKLNNLDVIKQELIEIENQFKLLDETGKRLRQAIIGKSWYCDSEYSQANILVTKYRKERDRMNALIDKADRLHQDNLKKSNQNTSNLNEKIEIKNQVESLEIRAKADNNRKQLEDEINKIDKNKANKFLRDEYEKLIGEIKSVLKENDVTLNRESLKLYNKISDFNIRLLKKYQEFEMLKNNSIQKLEDFKEYVNDLKFKDVEKILDNEEEIVDLFKFQHKYCNESSEKEYNDGIEKIENLIKDEKFKEAQEQTEKLKKQFVEINVRTEKQYEKLLKEMDMVSKMYEAILELDYDIDIQYIDDDIKKGYKIEATLGDEIINFDKVCIDENGKPVIDIDHQESISGTCGNTMGKLMTKLQENGIFITDIKKDGRSAVYREGTEIKKNDNKVSTK